MEKSITKLAIMMAMFMSVTIVVSCGGDDDEVDGGGSVVNPASSKRISKMKCVEDNSVTGRWENEEYFFYDSQGRVIKLKEIKFGKDASVSTTIFDYEGNVINSITDTKWGTEKHNYILSNGRIIKDEENSDYITNYSYDNNGYIISSESPSKKILFTWTNGNLTKYTEYTEAPDNYSIQMEYTSIPWPKNFFFYIKGTNMEKCLEPLGAWGKMPKNLPSKYKAGDGTETFMDYSYTIENGLVTKIDIYYRISIYEYLTATYTIEWE